MNLHGDANSRRAPGSTWLRQYLPSLLAIASLGGPIGGAHADICKLPAWDGDVIISGDSTAGWSIEASGGAYGSLSVVPGHVGQALQLDYHLGTNPGAWIQARYDFPAPVDLSGFDVMGIKLHGSAAASGQSNRVRVMVADASGALGVFYGATIGDIAHIDRWLINMPLPKEFFTHQSWSDPPPIDWTRINRLFVPVEPPSAGTRMTSGQLAIDHIQVTRAERWAPPDGLESVTPNAAAAAAAVECIVGEQRSNGLFRSWKQQPDCNAALYDQALALLVLTREERWTAADALVAHLLATQKPEGHWARAWNCATGGEISQDKWVGDQAWIAHALEIYAARRSNPDAGAAAERAGDWLATQIDPSSGMVRTLCPADPDRSPSACIVPQYSTEGNFDAWLALTTLGRAVDADPVAIHLRTSFWDDQLNYWHRGFGDPRVALNANAWPSRGFALHPQQEIDPVKALHPLGFIRRTLATKSDDGTVCGLDFEGPVSVHFEGLASYVVAGGPEAQAYLDVLLAAQRADGCVPGSTDDWRTNEWWLTTWTGIAPTAWLYFALTGTPFGKTQCNDGSDNDSDGVADYPNDTDCASANDPLEAPDPDGDLVAACADNCTRVPNVGQADCNAGMDDDTFFPGVQHYGDVCDADLDDDEIVGATDFFGEFRTCLGADLSTEPRCACADFDGDGVVGATDFFGYLRPKIGKPPGPGAGDGETCGPTVCCPPTTCCNPVMGSCTLPGEVCIQ